ncbi:hypothetical protein GL981_03885 [Spiroplasma citri]|nr:hypothetical protein GL981_03885 [Spiroplasma citri]
MDDKLIEDNTDFLIKFTLENLELLKKLKIQLDQEISHLYELAKQKKQSIQHLQEKSKHNYSKIKNRNDFKNLIQHALLEKYIDEILNRFMFRIDTMILQYNLSEKYSKIINPVEINARSVYLTIKEQKIIQLKKC